MENLDKSLAAIIEKISSLGSTHGGEALTLAGKVAQISYAAPLVIFPIFLTASITLGLTAYKLFSKSETTSKPYATDAYEGFGWVTSIGTVILSIVTAVGAVYFFNLKVWMAAFDPNFALALKVLDTVSK